MSAGKATRFELLGDIVPLAKAVPADGYAPRRQLGGWIATYGTILDTGVVEPTQDREGHVFEAARALGRIDWSGYLRKGIWNDTHDPIYVGVPTALEFHDATSELAKAHRRVGFWTEGHLFDRNDPQSWTRFTTYEPTETDLARADHFWTLATMLKGLPRPLGFSAHGRMILSKCGKRIVWAQVDENAVCETPQNAFATAQPLRLASSVRLNEAMVGATPCGNCTCPPGARCPVLAKAVPQPATARVDPPQPGTGRVDPTNIRPKDVDFDERVELLVHLLVQEHHIPEARARAWVTKYLTEAPVP